MTTAIVVAVIALAVIVLTWMGLQFASSVDLLAHPPPPLPPGEGDEAEEVSASSLPGPGIETAAPRVVMTGMVEGAAPSKDRRGMIEVTISISGGARSLYPRTVKILAATASLQDYGPMVGRAVRIEISRLDGEES